MMDIERTQPVGEETDSECPWCSALLYQDVEVRYCPECPFSAMYSADLSNAPPHIIAAYAKWAAERHAGSQQ